jgi:hypothetical protein
VQGKRASRAAREWGPVRRGAHSETTVRGSKCVRQFAIMAWAGETSLPKTEHEVKSCLD